MIVYNEQCTSIQLFKSANFETGTAKYPQVLIAPGDLGAPKI